MHLNRLVLVVMTAVAGWIWLWPPAAHGQADTCLVSTVQGEVRGIDRGDSCEFRAVPFGASTAGARRWKPPVAAAPWAPAVLDATIAAPFCPQINPAGLPEVEHLGATSSPWTGPAGHCLAARWIVHIGVGRVRWTEWRAIRRRE